MDEKHYVAALYWRAYRLYKAAMLKDLRSGYTNGANGALFVVFGHLYALTSRDGLAASRCYRHLSRYQTC